MLKIFIGYDERQPISYSVLQHSILSRSSKPISITPLVLDTLPLKRRGLTPFTFSRFLVPYLCNYEGWALFLDIDMIVKDDISKLFDMRDEKYAVMVSQNDLRFEWASAMLFNCAKCKKLTPDYVETTNDALHRIEFVEPKDVGDFPREWNHLVGYDEPRAKPSLIHYTQGIPCFPETSDSEHALAWKEEHDALNSSMPWEVLMGHSVHSTVINGKRLPRYKEKLHASRR